MGLVLLPGGGKVLRANSETPLAARAGDILFAGDSLQVEGSPRQFSLLPSEDFETLEPAATWFSNRNS